MLEETKRLADLYCTGCDWSDWLRKESVQCSRQWLR